MVYHEDHFISHQILIITASILSTLLFITTSQFLTTNNMLSEELIFQLILKSQSSIINVLFQVIVIGLFIVTFHLYSNTFECHLKVSKFVSNSEASPIFKSSEASILTKSHQKLFISLFPSSTNQE